MLRAAFRFFLLVLVAGLTLMADAHGQLLTYKQILDLPNRPQPDFKIAYGDDPNQYGELWLPKRAAGANDKQLFPVALMIHGGCWRADLPGPELMAFQADALRAAGIAVWSITYRRVGGASGGYPGTFLDAANGADKLYELAQKYPLDLERVVATGHSAGGHLALWLAARANIDSASPLKSAKPLPLNAVVAVAGIPDLAYASVSLTACGEHAVDKLVDRSQRTRLGDAIWKDVSPAELLPLKLKQTLVSGVYDPIVAPAHAHRYKMRAAAAGESVELVTLDNAGHFELISPWTAQGHEVVNLIVSAVR